MLLHLVADYGVGDLAVAEVRQRLAMHLPDADVVYTPVPAFDTISAGFCVAQLGLTEGPPDRIVYHNVAPRADADAPRPENEGEPLVAATLANGVLVVGPNSRYVLSFLRDELDELHEVTVPETGSQFRSRDAFPALLPALGRGDSSLLGRRISAAELPGPPERAVAYVDGFGNLKTTWSAAPAPPGTPVRVRIGEVTANAVIGDGTFAVPAGGLSFAPGSSGWRGCRGAERVWLELFARGHSAAEIFGFPPAGAPVEVLS